MMTTRTAFAGAAISLTAWIVLAFVTAIPRGWVHVLLAVGATLVAVGIVQTPPANGRP